VFGVPVPGQDLVAVGDEIGSESHSHVSEPHNADATLYQVGLGSSSINRRG
jgi:hypothetical protein